jgi:hypothetical protein
LAVVDGIVGGEDRQLSLSASRPVQLAMNGAAEKRMRRKLLRDVKNLGVWFALVSSPKKTPREKQNLAKTRPTLQNERGARVTLPCEIGN